MQREKWALEHPTCLFNIPLLGIGCMLTVILKVIVHFFFFLCRKDGSEKSSL